VVTIEVNSSFDSLHAGDSLLIKATIFLPDLVDSIALIVNSSHDTTVTDFVLLDDSHAYAEYMHVISVCDSLHI
jgi:hypothetical protein